MRLSLSLSFLLFPALALTGCANNSGDQRDTAPLAPGEILTAEWSGPYGGVPPFDRIEVADFEPALEAAMAAKLTEVDAIVANKEPATFENTIEALERSGAELRRVKAMYEIWSLSLSSPGFQEVEGRVAPKLAGFDDQITQNQALFARIAAVHDAAAKDELTPEQQRLVWKLYHDFLRRGAKLDATAKARLSELNQRLAALYTSFAQNVLHDESELYLALTAESELAGLPPALVAAAAAAAVARGLEGQWVINNTRSSVQPFLTYADRRDLRRQAWDLFVRRGDMGDEHDNNQIIQEIVQLRAERAALLGYQSHAHWSVENQMAKTPDSALQLLTAIWPAACDRVTEEVADMQAIADEAGLDIAIEPWDYRYYAEKVRKARYDIDQTEVSQYLQLDKLRDAMFWVAGELLGLDFRSVDDLPVYHPDVRVWEVTAREDGRHVGLFYFDPFARAGKRSGAWMINYREQSRFDGEVTAVISNNSNFVKAEPGQPVLISWDDATTLMHEFGHAVHGLCSDVNYPSLSGLQVARDFVEFPSQLLEHWLSTPELLQRFALHYQTGEPIPETLVRRLERASTFNQGFDTTEALSSALIDMRVHLLGTEPIDPAQFEADNLEELGMPSEIVMRHRMPQFLHIFSSDEYSAGYYSYTWSDVLTADAYEAFTEASGPYDPEVAARLIECVLSVGNTVDPAEAYADFRGREPDWQALMRKRGLDPDTH